MIKSIQLIKEKSRLDIEFVTKHSHKLEVDTSFIDDSTSTIEIIFEKPIVKFRNHDYSWVVTNKRLLSNWYAPKIIVLENGQIVQANRHYGIWEVNPKNRNTLLWHFNVKNAQPIVKYGIKNAKKIVQSVSKSESPNKLELLFPVGKGIEVSRSKVPFSAVACFTDHCDFDTEENLKKQRQFFKTHNIKLTKGFFLNHYSKRADTASYEKNRKELKAWIEDGHELAYHSLSQSIKPIEDSIVDFKDFMPPLKNINTWIDHGYQPYNVSQYFNEENLKEIYGTKLRENGVDIVWNYIDSGSAVEGVINQLNPNQFTLKHYYKGIKHLKLKVRLGKLIKTIIFHYFNNTDNLRLYYRLAKYFKSLNRKESIRNYMQMVSSSFKLLKLLSPIILLWNTKKNKIFPLAEYAPVIFNQDITGKTFITFQTIEMTDLTMGLHSDNIDLLIKESGLFIGHTYFSAPLNYHQGKLFKTDNEIDKLVEHNFSYLSEKIESKDIWNPTLSELVDYLKKFKMISFDCNDEGILTVNDDNQFAYREV